MENRNQKIVRTSIIGIAANVMLAAFKATVGALAGSLAIIMDAVNNLSDAVSSVITIIGTKLSERPADRMHPFGYGRVEYFSAIIISVIVLTTGLSSLVESVKKILHPTAPTYTTITLVIVAVAIVVKIILGRYVKHQGKALSSDALIASGSDALFDAVITLSTLVSAAIMLIWNISVDGYLGAIISIVIVKSGVDMLKSPINELLGSRVSSELVKEVKREVAFFQGVHGVYDLILNTYGPSTFIGSMHIGVYDTMKASEIHQLVRRISEDLYEKFGIISTVSIYAINTGETFAAKMQRSIMKKVSDNKNILSAHAFYVDAEHRTVSLDIIPQYDVDDAKLKADFENDLKKEYPDYNFKILIDYNYSEEE